MAYKGRSRPGDEGRLGDGADEVAGAAGDRGGEDRLTQKEQLQEVRKEFGWTQADAAEFAGVTSRAWQMWEASDREAPAMLWKLLELRRELQRARPAFSWDQFNEEQAARSGAMIVRPRRITYGEER